MFNRYSNIILYLQLVARGFEAKGRGSLNLKGTSRAQRSGSIRVVHATFLQRSVGATGSASSAPLRSHRAAVELPTDPREPVLLEPLFGTLFVSLESSALRVHSLEVQHANIF